MKYLGLKRLTTGFTDGIDIAPPVEGSDGK
jgi:hypothetical protein